MSKASRDRISGAGRHSEKEGKERKSGQISRTMHKVHYIIWDFIKILHFGWKRRNWQKFTNIPQMILKNQDGG